MKYEEEYDDLGAWEIAERMAIGAIIGVPIIMIAIFLVLTFKPL